MRQKWNGNRARIIYFNSNCVKFRQEAAAMLSSVVPIDTAGKCTVENASAIDIKEEFPNIGVTTNKENWKLYRHYKYCLVMENTRRAGYISEKIVWAFLGGCLPIYWGTLDVNEVFNRNAFLFYRPEKTLDDIRYLELNHSAYLERLNAPILSKGNKTIREFFSLTDELEGGYLKRRIRSALGLE